MGNSDLIQYLRSFVTSRRWDLMQEVLNHRTRYITLALENLYQPHNASAVLRSCDAFGIQDVHIIENSNKYRINPDVELGTAQWLSLNRYDKKEFNTDLAYEELRKKGYRIAATVPSTIAPGTTVKTLSEIDLQSGPIALVFGTELTGLSDYAIEQADEHISIPMHGFVESFNISVSAALCLYDLSTRLRKSQLEWHLEEEEKEELRLTWLRNSIKRWEDLEKEFLNRQVG